MGLKYADRLAWAKERFERNFVELDCLIENLRIEWDSRRPQQDDEDDTVSAAADILLFACEQVSDAIGVLKDGA